MRMGVKKLIHQRRAFERGRVRGRVSVYGTYGVTVSLFAGLLAEMAGIKHTYTLVAVYVDELDRWFVAEHHGLPVVLSPATVMPVKWLWEIYLEGAAAAGRLRLLGRER